MNYSVLAIASCLLSSACLSMSNNVGEIPTETESGATESETESETDPNQGQGETDSEPTTGEQTGEQTGNETGNETGEQTGDETGDESTGEPAGPCLDESQTCFDYQPLDCGAAPACDVLEIEDSSLLDPPIRQLAFINPEAATCILQGLTAGVVGEYEILREPGGQFSRYHRLEVLADGSVLVRTEAYEDINCDIIDQRLMLRPPEFFEACLNETDEQLILDCLLTAGDPEQCVADGAICPQ